MFVVNYSHRFTFFLGILKKKDPNSIVLNNYIVIQLPYSHPAKFYPFNPNACFLVQCTLHVLNLSPYGAKPGKVKCSANTCIMLPAASSDWPGAATGLHTGSVPPEMPGHQPHPLPHAPWRTEGRSYTNPTPQRRCSQTASHHTGPVQSCLIPCGVWTHEPSSLGVPRTAVWKQDKEGYSEAAIKEQLLWHGGFTMASSSS